jgi:hypothetical protein
MAKNKTQDIDETEADSKPAKVKKNKTKAPAEDDFGGPAERSDFKLADHVGALLLITPKSLEEGIETTFGEADAIKADVVVLTNNKGKALDEPVEETGVLIFQRVVIGQLTDLIGIRRALGKIGTGVAKKGQSAPFLIEQPDDDDKALAREYLATIDPFSAKSKNKAK